MYYYYLGLRENDLLQKRKQLHSIERRNSNDLGRGEVLTMNLSNFKTVPSTPVLLSYRVWIGKLNQKNEKSNLKLVKVFSLIKEIQRIKPVDRNYLKRFLEYDSRIKVALLAFESDYMGTKSNGFLKKQQVLLLTEYRSFLTLARDDNFLKSNAKNSYVRQELILRYKDLPKEKIYYQNTNQFFIDKTCFFIELTYFFRQEYNRGKTTDALILPPIIKRKTYELYLINVDRYTLSSLYQLFAMHSSLNIFKIDL